MRYLRLLVNIILPFFIITSCTQQEIDIFTQGGGRFDITLVDDIAKTRSLPSEITDEMANNFNLTINKENGVKAFKGSMQKYNEQQPSFAPGKYLISANLGENQVLALDAPYYEATPGEYEITAGETTTVALTCTVANALASFAFENPEVVSSYLKSYEIITRIGDTEVSCTVGDGKNPYFQEDQTVEFILKGISAQDVPVEYTFATITKSERQKNYKYTLILGGSQEGDAQLNISVDAQVDIVSISETIPQEWLPKPQITAEGFDSNNSVSHTETDEAKPLSINYTSSLPTQDIEITLKFEDEQYTSLNGTYNLSSIENSVYNQLIQAGIKLPQLTSTEGKIDLSQLIENLQTKNGETTTNKIAVRVKANNRWSSEEGQEYTIQTKTPEFTITVYPKNIWTKEFSVTPLTLENVTAGNFLKLSQNIKYQYSLDGQSGWQDLSADMTVRDLNPANKYYVRSVYRDVIYSDIVQVTTYPILNLENGNMESWTDKELGYYFNLLAWNKKPLMTYYPWTTEPYWNTNNEFTTRLRDKWSPPLSIIYLYNSFPAVSYTKTANSGTWAAELRSTAAGRGNTISSDLEFNKVPGELFLGGITVNKSGTDASPNDNYVIDEGIAFSSRPTALQFSYEYLPYGNDEWKAYVAIFDANNKIIAENTFTNGEEVSNYQTTTITFNYINDNNIVPAKIYVYFASSKYRGNELPYRSADVTTWIGDSQRTDQTLVGSILRIDDISLVYDK